MNEPSRLTNEELAAEAGSFDPGRYPIAHEIEIEHFRDLYSNAPSETARDLGVAVESHGQSLLLAAAGVPHLMFTRGHVGRKGVLNLDELDAMLASLADTGVQAFLIHVDATVSFDEAKKVFEKRGLVPYRRPWVKLLRGVEPVPRVQTDLDVSEVTGDQASLCAEMMMQGFGLPSQGARLYGATIGREGWRWYMASENGVPAAAGLLFQRGNVAYLAGGVTLPEFRRRRAQGALMQRRIEDALKAGAEHVASETGFPFPDGENPSYRNMMHFGLRAVGTRHNFGPPGVEW
jgi:hypothetical protein